MRGDLNNPKFDYGTLIRDAIGNVLRRIVTAPFRFIAGLFGGRADEDLQSITFEPGSARLIPSEREQLEKVAQALKGRQQLKLVVHGAYDPQADARALRDTQVRRELVQALGSKVGEREDPGPIAFDDPDTQRALEKMMTARAGSDAVEKLASEYAKNTGKEVQRVNPVLAVFRRGRGTDPSTKRCFSVSLTAAAGGYRACGSGSATRALYHGLPRQDRYRQRTNHGRQDRNGGRRQGAGCQAYIGGGLMRATDAPRGGVSIAKRSCALRST